jgi:Tol biopolymer transport system component
VVPTSWSRDGRFLLYYTTNTPKTGTDLWVLRLEDQKAVRLLGTESNELFGAFSPDMRWIAYMSDESGRNEIYVRPFVASGPSGEPALGAGKSAVSRDGVATPPSWRSDSKEIRFGGAFGQGKPPTMMTVDVNGSGPVGAPRQVGTIRTALTSGTVTADGKRYLVSVPVNQHAGITPFTVVLNWPALLKK